MADLLYVCVRPEVAAADAEHRSFIRALGVSVDRLDLLREPLRDDIVGRYRGVVVGGSPLNVTEPEPSDLQRRVEADLERLARAALDAQVHAFFTCYGIGVVTRMLGGAVTHDHPEEAQAAWMALTPSAASDPVFGPSAPGFLALTAHKESAPVAPPGAVLLAGNEACPVEAYRVGTHLWATQFHPESTPQDFVERMGFYRSGGYFSDAEFDAVSAAVLAAPVADAASLLARFAAQATAD